MADQFMRLVAGSARFDRKRFAQDFKVFARKERKPRARQGPAADDELDFFGNAKKAGAGGKGAKAGRAAKKGGKDGEEEEEERSGSDDDDSSDSSSSGGDDSSDSSDGSDSEGDEALTAAERVQRRRRKVRELRKKHRIGVRGSDVPPPARSFADMKGVPEYLVRNLTAPVPDGLGFERPTPIQMQAVPAMLAGRELLACAPTGSGKTAAFVVPLLTALAEPRAEGFRAVVLSPTKELADQIHRQFQVLARGRKWRVHALTKANANSNNFGPGSSRRKDVLVSTPMRLVHLIQSGGVDLTAVRHLVLDEADKLFDMGFLEQVDTIMGACTAKGLATSLFSATMFQGVEALARTVLKDPVRVTVGTRNGAAPSVSQELVFVGREDGKLLAMRQLVQKGLRPPVLVFVQSKERAKQLFHELVYDGINVDAIHADRTPAQRTAVIRKFRLGEIWVLICTDLMARGIDFKGVNVVVNYDFPQTTVNYIHRVGRTGRGGREGHAVTFFTEGDTDLLRSIAGVMRESGCEVPDWMMRLRKAGRARQEQLRAAPRTRQPIAAPSLDAPAKPSKGGRKGAKKRKRAGKGADGGGGGGKRPAR